MTKRVSAKLFKKGCLHHFDAEARGTNFCVKKYTVETNVN
jgi:hypothetical protein